MARCEIKGSRTSFWSFLGDINTGLLTKFKSIEFLTPFDNLRAKPNKKIMYKDISSAHS